MTIASKTIMLLLLHLHGFTNEYDALDQYMAHVSGWIELKKSSGIDYSEDLEIYNHLLTVREELLNQNYKG
jgi:hypothetical protein